MLKLVKKQFSIRKLTVLIISIPLIIAFPGIALAEPPLRRASIYELINQVFINQNQAKEKARLIPGDFLETEANSRADLLFNEGTLVRAPANTDFHFRAGTRHFELTDGTALFILQPGGNERTLKTPNAQIKAEGGTVFWTTYNADTNQTRVGVFASPNSSVKVSRIEKYTAPAHTKPPVELEAGQAIDIVRRDADPIQTFSLTTFYQTSGIADGLRPGDNLDSYSSQVRAILETAQENTSSALQKQQQLLQESRQANPSIQQNLSTEETGNAMGTELGEIEMIEMPQ